MRWIAIFATLGRVSDGEREDWARPTRPPTSYASAWQGSDSPVADPIPGGSNRRIGPLVPILLLLLLTVVVLLAALAFGSPQARSDQFSDQERVDLRARAQISTVRVAARACPGVTRGSGFIVEGLVFTSGHLVENDSRIKVDRPGQAVESVIVGASSSLDVAVARSEGVIAVPLSMAATATPEGERVLLAGFPDGGEFAATEAEVVRYASASEWGVQGDRVMLLRPGIRAGFSGGPVLDRDGRVVGMLAGVDVLSGFGVAIPADELGVVVRLAGETWESGGTVAHSPEPCPG